MCASIVAARKIVNEKSVPRPRVGQGILYSTAYHFCMQNAFIIDAVQCARALAFFQAEQIMASDKYRLAENEYFRLRGQFDTGRLTQEQFDEKLRELMVQDEQGRYWMLGAESGKWYYYDGAKWVQGEPNMGTATAAVAPVAAAATSPVTSTPPETPSPTTAQARSIPLVPILIGVGLVILAIAAFLLFQNRDQIFVAQRATPITPILPPTITRAPSPTAPIGVPTAAPPQPTPTLEIPTEIPTRAPATEILATAPPAVTIVVVTAEPTATNELPTLLPTVTNVPPTLAPTKPFATATTIPPTRTPLPSYPPNVYVTDITYSPAAAKRNQDVTFTATFLNTTGGNASYNWLILLFDPNKTGNNKGFGESPAQVISIPKGQSQFSTTFTPVRGPGGCINLYMRAGWKISAFDKPIFPNTSGDPATVFFDVC